MKKQSMFEKCRSVHPSASLWLLHARKLRAGHFWRLRRTRCSKVVEVSGVGVMIRDNAVVVTWCCWFISPCVIVVATWKLTENRKLTLFFILHFSF